MAAEDRLRPLGVFGRTGEERSELAALAPILRRHGDALAAGIARDLLSCQSTRSALAAPERRAAALGLLRQGLRRVADPVGDPERARVQRNLGATWAQLGLGAESVLRAWSQLYSALMAHVEAWWGCDAERVDRLARSLRAAMLSDLETLLRAYRESSGRIRKPGRILVVDTEPRWLDRIDAMLEHLRGRVCCVTDAREAIALARIYPFDLAIIEWSLTGSRSGLEVARALRRSRPGIACIMITSQPTAWVRARARAAGSPRVLGKPFEAAALRSAVADLFSDGA
jgi:CheY-like chemotaxis protein